MPATKIYDPLTGKRFSLEGLISRLGTLAVAKKYGVSESTVYKWKRGLHKPSRHTLSKTLKGFF